MVFRVKSAILGNNLTFGGYLINELSMPYQKQRRMNMLTSYENVLLPIKASTYKNVR